MSVPTATAGLRARTTLGDLRRATTPLKRVVPRGFEIIKGEVEVAVKGGVLTLRGNNWSVDAQFTFKGAGERSGVARLNVHALDAFLRALSVGLSRKDAAAQEVILESRTVETPEGGIPHVTISCGKYSVGLRSQVTELASHTFKGRAVGKFERTHLDAVLRRVGVAAATDETLPILANIQAVLDSEGVVLRATDRYRLVTDRLRPVGKMNMTDNDGEGLLLQWTDVREALTMLQGDVVTLSWSKQDKRVCFDDGQVRYTASVFDGTYPSVSRLIPTERSTFAQASRTEVVSAAARATALAEATSKSARRIAILQSGQEGLSIYPLSGDNLTEMTVPPVPSRESKGEFKAGVDMAILNPVLRSAPGKELVLIQNQPNRPILIEGSGHPDYTALVMPSRVEGL